MSRARDKRRGMYFIELRRRFVSDRVWYALAVAAMAVGAVIEGGLTLKALGTFALAVAVTAAWVLHRRGRRHRASDAPRRSSREWAIAGFVTCFLIGLSLFLQR